MTISIPTVRFTKHCISFSRPPWSARIRLTIQNVKTSGYTNAVSFDMNLAHDCNEALWASNQPFLTFVSFSRLNNFWWFSIMSHTPHPSPHPLTCALSCFSSYFLGAATSLAILLSPDIARSLFLILNQGRVLIATLEIIAWPFAVKEALISAPCSRARYSGLSAAVCRVDFRIVIWGHALRIIRHQACRTLRTRHTPTRTSCFWEYRFQDLFDSPHRYAARTCRLLDDHEHRIGKNLSTWVSLYRLFSVPRAASNSGAASRMRKLLECLLYTETSIIVSCPTLK